MTRPRVADDFPAIRARLEELRRERARASVREDDRMPIVPRRPNSWLSLTNERPIIAPYDRRFIRTETQG
jgi:hypothetical protein